MTRKSRLELPFGLLRTIAAMILIPFFRFKVHGQDYLAGCRGPVILAGNHTGYLDSLAVLVGCERYFQFLMTDEVFSWGLIGKVVRYGNIIPLYQGREKRGLIEALQVLRNGGSICIFPEGKLTQDGELNPFKAGAAFLQEKSGATIVPFWIEGGFEAWPQVNQWPTFRQVSLHFGVPIEAGLCRTRSEVVQIIEQRILAMKGHIPQLVEPRGAMPVMMEVALSEESASFEG